MPKSITKEKQTAGFERYAFEAALREHPGNREAALVFQDWLEEHGYTNMGAKRVVTATIRLELDTRVHKRICEMFSRSNSMMRALADNIGYAVHTSFEVHPTIFIEPGTFFPIIYRDGGFYRTPSKDEYQATHPIHMLPINATWVFPTITIRVGAGWIKDLWFSEDGRIG